MSRVSLDELGRILNEMHIEADNKLLIVKLGGLEPLIRQMLSPNVEVQCNAVGCVTNLATHGTYAGGLRITPHRMLSVHITMRFPFR